MPWIHGDWIDDEDAPPAPPRRWAFDHYIRQVFERAGWKPLPPPAPVCAGDAMAFATLLLEEFGGLQVGETGAGLDGSANDLDFWTAPKRADASAIRAWPWTQDGAAFGFAHREYIVLVVDARGHFLAFTDVDDKLHDFGTDFAHFAETLLRGLPWPASIAPDHAG